MHRDIHSTWCHSRLTLSFLHRSDDPAVNAANLEKDPALAWHVICAYVWRPAFPNPYILFDAPYGAQLRKYIPTLFTATYAVQSASTSRHCLLPRMQRSQHVPPTTLPFPKPIL